MDNMDCFSSDEEEEEGEDEKSTQNLDKKSKTDDSYVEGLTQDLPVMSALKSNNRSQSER